MAVSRVGVFGGFPDPRAPQNTNLEFVKDSCFLALPDLFQWIWRGILPLNTISGHFLTISGRSVLDHLARKTGQSKIATSSAGGRILRLHSGVFVFALCVCPLRKPSRDLPFSNLNRHGPLLSKMHVQRHSVDRGELSSRKRSVFGQKQAVGIEPGARVQNRAGVVSAIVGAPLGVRKFFCTKWSKKVQFDLP